MEQILIKFNKKFQGVNLDEYFKFIEQHQVLKFEKFKTAKHHILPRWAFPEFSKFSEHPWNKAILSHKDHFIAHLLLAKHWRVIQNTVTINRIITKDWNLIDEAWLAQYQLVKEQIGKHISQNNLGRKHSIVAIQKISEASKRSNKFRVEKGIHSSQTPEHSKRMTDMNNRLVELGQHPFMKRADGTSISSDRANRGIQGFQLRTHEDLSHQSTVNNKIRIENGTHNFLDKQAAKIRAAQRLKEGTHNFVGKGIVTLIDKQGVGHRLPKSILDYWKTSGLPMLEWEFVAIASKESKRRRLLIQRK